VARQFEKLGAAVIDADRLGHEVLRMAEVKERLVEEFGHRVLDTNGEVCRPQLAEIVFQPDSPAGGNSLVRLEKITHPEIGKLIRQQLLELAAQGFQVVVLDAAVMFKAAWDRMCDRIVFVESNYATRLERALARGWTKAQLDAREAQQLPVEQKRARATDVIVNDETSSTTVEDQVKNLWQRWFGDVPPSET
jgi:dephospho-CoA kinase